MPDNLTTSVQFLKSVGPMRAESFAQIGIKSILDLLYYFPTKYLDRSTILNSVKVVQYLRNGYDGEVTIIGEVEETNLIRYGRKQIFKVRMRDASGYFECIWFQGIKYFKDLFKEGEFYAVSAKPVLTRYGHLQMVHPDFDRLAEKESKDFLNTGKIIPFYRLPKELRASNLGDFSLRKIIHQAVEQFADEVKETLPAEIIASKKLLPLNKTIRQMHFPESPGEIDAARYRLKFEELFYFQCLVALRKKLIEKKRKEIQHKVHSKIIKAFLDSLPFQLTKAQLRVLSEIRKDLESSSPMNRLLQGDVGSGKTIVALIAMLIVATNDAQAVLMAPTEILADQHWKRIAKLVEPFGLKTCALIGGQRKSERTKILDGIRNGYYNIIIGTHALIEENVDYHKLSLVVIDEQHRFGVVQRYRLIEKGTRPDILIMTATPIPRTLSMTLYGDLDISIIDEMPSNRLPVKTILRGERKMEEIYKFIINKRNEGYQTFLVYPLVEESEKLELKAAETFYNELKETHLKDLSIGLIHGRMKWQEKEQVMLDFAAGKYDVLVSTTVIEVGIDIPNANIIVIHDAFRFGLSQLHQLRGRVGRSNKQSYCVLVTKDELAVRVNQLNFNFDYLSQEEIERHKTIIRLNAMIRYQSGFDIAEVDMKLRGPGDIFGTKQSGLPELRYSNLSEDGKILSDARTLAFEIISNDPNLAHEKNSLVKKILVEKFSDAIHLSQIG